MWHGRTCLTKAKSFAALAQGTTRELVAATLKPNSGAAPFVDIPKPARRYLPQLQRITLLDAQARYRSSFPQLINSVEPKFLVHDANIDGSFLSRQLHTDEGKVVSWVEFESISK